MARTDLAVYSGDDALNLGWLAHGAVGIVSVVAHVAGPRYAAMVRAAADNDIATARGVHRELLPAVRAIMNVTQGAIMVKAALHLQGVLASPAVRLPLVEATPEQVATLRRGLAESALLEVDA